MKIKIQNNIYIDFHTHKTYSFPDPQLLFIKSFSIFDLLTNPYDLDSKLSEYPKTLLSILPNYYFTIGIHPWDVEKIRDIQPLIRIIKTICKTNYCLGIGEIGLDKYKPLFDKQYQIFLHQLQLAYELKKPVVIHCVKAYNHLLEIKTSFKNQTWAVHGYHSSSEMARQLQKRNIFLSFGSYIKSHKIKQVLNNIDLNLFFLETDVDKINIKQIYAQASEIIKLPLQSLVKQVVKNFNNFFNGNE